MSKLDDHLPEYPTLPVSARNKRTGTEYVIVNDAGYGLLRCYTKKGFESMNGTLALKDNIELFEPLAPIAESRLVMKIALLMYWKLVEVA